MPKIVKWQGAKDLFVGHFVIMFIAVSVGLPVALIAVDKGLMWPAFIMPILLGIYGIISASRFHRRFPCPNCKKLLRSEKFRKDDSEVRFLCKDCDILWETGIKWGEGD